MILNLFQDLSVSISERKCEYEVFTVCFNGNLYFFHDYSLPICDAGHGCRRRDTLVYGCTVQYKSVLIFY